MTWHSEKMNQPEGITNLNDVDKILFPGMVVILDKGMSNESCVTVVSQTPLRMYTTVSDGDIQWVVMTYRLSIY